MFSLLNMAVNMTLPAFAAERRAAAPCCVTVACCCWVSEARRRRSISPARTALNSKPAARRCCSRMMGQTDGRTDIRPFHRPCSAYCAGSVSTSAVTPSSNLTNQGSDVGGQMSGHWTGCAVRCSLSCMSVLSERQEVVMTTRRRCCYLSFQCVIFITLHALHSRNFPTRRDFSPRRKGGLSLSIKCPLT